MLVNKSQIKLMNINIVNGCLVIFLSNFPSNKTLIKKKTSTPNINGSVGIEIPKPKSKSRIFTAKGVENAISNIILSIETKYKITIKRTTGVTAPQSTLCFTTKYKFKAINMMLIR